MAQRPRNRPVTIRDVAALAGVSCTTVSHALSGNRQVSPATADRVRRVVDQLGYVPASYARNLQSGSTGVVALLVPDIRNDFYATLAKGTEDAAHEAGYHLILCNTSGDVSREESYLELIRARFIDGMIYAAGVTPTQVHLDALRGRFPVVFADEAFPTITDIPVVMADHYDGGRLIGEHLASLRHEHAVVYTGPGDPFCTVERAQGFTDAFGGTVETLSGSFDHESGATLVRELLHRPGGLRGATAIVAANDLMALGALDALREADIPCPDAVSVVGFDDVRDAALARPPLTTVAQPAYDIGSRSMHALIEEITSDHRGHRVVEMERLGVRLVARESTAVPRDRR